MVTLTPIMKVEWETDSVKKKHEKWEYHYTCCVCKKNFLEEDVVSFFEEEENYGIVGSRNYCKKCYGEIF